MAHGLATVAPPARFPLANPSGSDPIDARRRTDQRKGCHVVLTHHPGMERLAGAREELDADELDPTALAGNLRDLARINRWLGGVRLSRMALADLERSATPARRQAGEVFRILDVGTGGADVPAALLASWTGPGRLEVVAIDRNPAIVAAASTMLERNGTTGPRGLELRVADGLALPDPDEAFDVAHASLVLHHLDPGDAVALIREMARVARVGIVLNDLSRSRLGWIGAWLMGHVLTRNRFTRSDAPMSVRRAYTASEASAMLREAGLAIVSRRFGVFHHRWAIAAARTR